MTKSLRAWEVLGLVTGTSICTSRRSAGTALWSSGLEPAEAVSTHAGDDPWCEEGEGCRDGSGPAGERER